MRNPLFIAIGVHRAQGLDKLDGVLASVSDMVGWAARSGYDPVVVTDDPAQPVADRDVTVDRIRRALPEDVLLDRPRIVVYFCGHGLYAPADQHWVLSAGPDNRRISAFGFQEALDTYGPKQIAVFSDACSTPWVHNATADNVVDNYLGDTEGAQKEEFFSTREGAPSFAVPARDGAPAYCVFSRVLSEVLSAADPDPGALDPLYLQAGRRVISSHSLASYLETRVPAVALASGKKQRPKCSPGFRPLGNLYRDYGPALPAAPQASASRLWSFGLGGGSGQKSFRIRRNLKSSPTSPAQPEAPELDREALRAERQHLSRSEWRAPLVDFAANTIFGACSEAERDRLLFIDRGRDLPEPVVDGQLIQAPTGYAQTLYRLDHPGPSIVQCGDFFTPVSPYQGLWCAMAFRSDADAMDPAYAARGADLLSWGSIHLYEGHRFASSVEALKGLSNGILTADDTTRLAHALREGKHLDPMLGIVSAYLYAQIGDRDSIRRMAFFYRAHNQPVPFDVALLSNLKLQRDEGGFFIDVPAVGETPQPFRDAEAPDYTWRATGEATVRVAGLTPFLPAGWRLLGRSEHAIHRVCAELAVDLSNSAIATLEGQVAGQALRQAFLEFHQSPP